MKWLIVCILLTGCSTTQLYTASTSLIVVDYSQTLDIVHKGHLELNPILGDYPSRERVHTLIGAGLIAHTMLAVYLPEKEKRIYLWSIIIAETLAVANNVRVGVDFRF